VAPNFQSVEFNVQRVGCFLVVFEGVSLISSPATQVATPWSHTNPKKIKGKGASLILFSVTNNVLVIDDYLVSVNREEA
jgi:hypothetical protein